MKAKIAIVEDELLVVQDLTTILEGASHHVVGHAVSGQAGLELVEATSPDLVLLDIKLKGDMTGLDLAKAINGKVSFLFITSLKDATSRAEIASLSAGGYLLKPFVEEELLVNVQLALSRRDRQASRNPVFTGFMVRDGSSLKRVNAGEIVLAKGEDNYTNILMNNGREYLVSHTLKSVEAKLTETNSFYRIHKSYVVNLDYLKGVEGQNIVIGDRIIPIGKSYRAGLFQRFDIL